MDALYSTNSTSVLIPRQEEKARHGGGFKWITLEKHMVTQLQSPNTSRYGMEERFVFHFPKMFSIVIVGIEKNMICLHCCNNGSRCG
ncbi:hypothetical protein TNCV_1424721 [Trichonephila clavipes]|nr:hypothetical protein TNCV_1424721 [Trichonephila clavipes]